MSKSVHFRWIRHKAEILRDVGFNADGNLHNPNGYPEEIVRVAVSDAIARGKARRKEASAKAIVTRKRRRDNRVHSIAAKFLRNESIGPQHKCCICRRALTDDVSIERGIGSECWQDVLRAMDQTSAA
ncbi:MAG: DUF6011 domain-containing protein [Rhodomicrobium sp.]